jgi:hypothetical protein
MRLAQSLYLGGLIWVLTACVAVAGAARGVAWANVPTHVGAVEVVQHDASAPPRLRRRPPGRHNPGGGPLR